MRASAERIGRICFPMPLAPVVILAAAVSIILLVRGITCNQALAVMLTLVVLTIWQRDKLSGVVAAIFFFLVKPLFVRVAFAVDYHLCGSGGFDMLAITPALLISALIALQLYLDVASGKRIFADRTRILLGIFCGISFLSIFNPANSLFNGFAGFERVAMPNMMILFLVASLVRDSRDIDRIVKALLVLGLVSCTYAIGQFALGAYPWETDWLREVAFADSPHGLTVGLRGIELRIFSVFYGYMDFTFTNVLIFALALAYRAEWNARWRRAQVIYSLTWLAILILSLERMPLLMSLVAATVIYYLHSDRRRRKIILGSGICATLALVFTLNVAAPILRDTGASKLIRFAEMANPFSASSLADRARRNWAPTLQIVGANPLGVGVGYGSQTLATASVAESGLWMGPHNELLQKALETGLPGALAFLVLLISIFRDGMARLKSRRPEALFAAGMLAVTVAFWICGIVNLPFVGASGLTYWALAGALMAGARQNRNGRQTPDSSNPINSN